VFVFANGHGSEIFDVSANGYIIHFVPILLLALLFGLSTDYEVFLVTRIKEEYEQTGNHERSIETGMAKTGPLKLLVPVTMKLLGKLSWWKPGR
jgi:Predicted drug exporters of the RND superfamily